MAGLHGVLAIGAMAALLAVVMASAALWAGRGTRRWLDRALIVQASTAFLAAAAGAALLILGPRPPADALHALYGALLPIVPLVGRYAARRQSGARLGRSMTLVGVLAVGIVSRAFLTGG
jgi:hypothetical protein